MKSVLIAMVCMASAVICGCRTTSHPLVTGKTANVSHESFVVVREPTENCSDKPDELIQQVGFQHEEAVSNSDSYPSLEDNSTTTQIVATNNHESGGSCSLQELEQIAIACNPAIAELTAEIDSLKGKLVQAGLPPNPIVGVNGEDINEDGGAGRYGVYFGREIVRGNKLGRSRAVVCAEITAAEQKLAVVQQKLLTDVRKRFFDLLVAQEASAIADQLAGIARRAVEMSEKLFEGGEAAQTAVLQSELELENALVVKEQTENQRIAARRKLAALLGEHDIACSRVSGSPRQLLRLDEFELSFDQLVNASPEISQLFAEVEQRKRQLARECVEPIPNLTWQATVQFDTVTDDVVTGFQVGLPIPTLNRNQGAICQARHQVVAADRRAEKKVLELRQRLATAYESFLDAKIQIDAYETRVIPKAKETLELVNQGYRQGEVDFLQLLTSQRTYSQLNLVYLQKLRQAWRQHVDVQGLLLSGSLE